MKKTFGIIIVFLICIFLKTKIHSQYYSKKTDSLKVENFKHKVIYNEKFDSVFLIRGVSRGVDCGGVFILKNNDKITGYGFNVDKGKYRKLDSFEIAKINLTIITQSVNDTLIQNNNYSDCGAHYFWYCFSMYDKTKKIFQDFNIPFCNISTLDNKSLKENFHSSFAVPLGFTLGYKYAHVRGRLLSIPK